MGFHFRGHAISPTAGGMPEGFHLRFPSPSHQEDAGKMRPSERINAALNAPIELKKAVTMALVISLIAVGIGIASMLMVGVRR